ncbi:MAG: hypothetical protein GKR89_08720 [Candidatus Latescibacteria bacterium]|nr:hypothetical protein [Candidatus Latescibacterota bacterium]
MTASPVDPDRPDLIDRLRHLRRLVAAAELAAFLGLGLALISILGLFWVATEALLYLAPAGRGGLGAVLALLLILTLIAYLRPRWKRWPLAHFGHYVEVRLPHLQQRLTSALELGPSPRARQLYSTALLKATIAEAKDLLQQAPIRPLLPLQTIGQQARRLGLATGLVAVAMALFHPYLLPALHRCLHPGTQFERPPSVHISVSPGNTTLLKGEDLALQITFTGTAPRTASLERRESPQDSWGRREIAVARAASITHRLHQVKQSFSYQLVAPQGRSPIYRVEVIEPPSVEALHLEYHYPEYSGLAPRIDHESGDIAALVGTLVRFEISSNKSLAAAALVVDDSLRQKARIEGSKAFVEWRIDRDRHYLIELQDNAGIFNQEPIRYAIQATVDAYPQVSLVEPGRDMDLPEDQLVPLAVEASDDFGVSRLQLVARLNDEEPQRRLLPATPGPQIYLTHLWDLNNRNLLPEDRLYYHIEAFDNDQISGPKMAVSQEYVLRYPSLYELFDEAAEQQQNEVEVLEELAAGNEKIQQYLEEVRRQVLKTESLSWEQKKELEATLEGELERAEKLEELAQRLDETIEELGDNELASSQILEKLAALRQLMDEVSTPQLRQALQELQENLENPNPAELAEALKRFKEDQQAFQDQLDRNLALLEQVRNEQRLEATVRQAAELAQRQSRIDQELERPEAQNRLAQQEEDLQRDTGRLRRELDELAQSMQQLHPPTAARLDELASGMEKQGLEERMGQMAADLQQGNKEAAADQGQRLENDLDQLAANLQQTRQGYSEGQKQQLTQDMARSMRDLVGLSRAQESLRRDTAQSRPHEELAREQFALGQGAVQMTERIAALAQQTMALDPGLATTLGYALGHMQEAAQQLGQRRPDRSNEPQTAAMNYLNEAALLMRRSMANLADAQMPSSFAEIMQQMADLAQQQAGLNQATQENMAQGRRPGRNSQPGSQGQPMSQLANAQQNIFQALAQLARDMRGHRGAQKRIERIAEDMRAVLHDLQRRRPNQSTLQKQNRLYQRMLEASRSIHTQGSKKERQATLGQDLPYTGNSALPGDLGQSHDHLRQAMRQALEGPYPEEYRALIRHYYEFVYQDAITREGGQAP